MSRFKFRRDTAVWTKDDVEIGLMILKEHSWGIEYLGRKRNPNSKGYLYATASYHDNQHQFVSGKWFASGFTGGAFEYVATWTAKIPARAQQ